MAKSVKTILKLDRHKPGTIVTISAEQRRLFDAANKRIARLEVHNMQSETPLKQTDIYSFHNAARAITGAKGGNLSKAGKMTVEQLNSQIRLASKIMQDETLTVNGAQREQEEQRENWIDNLEQTYPDLERDDLEDIYDALIDYNSEHYEDSYLQWLYESWKESEHDEREHGLMQLLSAGKEHGMSVRESMEWLSEHSANQTWVSLSKKYLKQW